MLPSGPQTHYSRLASENSTCIESHSSYFQLSDSYTANVKAMKAFAGHMEILLSSEVLASFPLSAASHASTAVLLRGLQLTSSIRPYPDQNRGIRLPPCNQNPELARGLL